MLGIKTYLKKQSPRVWMWLLYGPRLWTNHFKVLPPSDRQILVTLGDKRPNRDIPRHLYTVFNFLADAGYNIYIYQKIDPKFYDWLKSYGRRMFSMKRLKFITDIPANTERMVYLFDHEDVAEALADGSFGMAEETHSLINRAIRDGAKKGLGLGESVGAMITKSRFPYGNLSLLATCHQAGVPATVHVAIGTDIIHQQSTADGAAIGQTSLADFRKLIGVVSTLGEGGVVGNLGSAVILPEVFLKAVSIARNLGHSVKNFTAFDFDMIRHYRPTENVLKRPTLLGGRAIHITGHHELMIPLLVSAIIEQL